MAISSKLVEPSEGIPQGNLVRNQNNFRLFQSFLRNIPFFGGAGGGWWLPPRTLKNPINPLTKRKKETTATFDTDFSQRTTAN